MKTRVGGGGGDAVRRRRRRGEKSDKVMPLSPGLGGGKRSPGRGRGNGAAYGEAGYRDFLVRSGVVVAVASTDEKGRQHAGEEEGAEEDDDDATRTTEVTFTSAASTTAASTAPSSAGHRAGTGGGGADAGVDAGGRGTPTPTPTPTPTRIAAVGTTPMQMADTTPTGTEAETNRDRGMRGADDDEDDDPSRDDGPDQKQPQPQPQPQPTEPRPSPPSHSRQASFHIFTSDDDDDGQQRWDGLWTRPPWSLLGRREDVVLGKERHEESGTPTTVASAESEMSRRRGGGGDEADLGGCVGDGDVAVESSSSGGGGGGGGGGRRFVFDDDEDDAPGGTEDDHDHDHDADADVDVDVAETAAGGGGGGGGGGRTRRAAAPPTSSAEEVICRILTGGGATTGEVEGRSGKDELVGEEEEDHREHEHEHAAVVDSDGDDEDDVNGVVAVSTAAKGRLLATSSAPDDAAAAIDEEAICRILTGGAGIHGGGGEDRRRRRRQCRSENDDDDDDDDDDGEVVCPWNSGPESSLPGCGSTPPSPADDAPSSCGRCDDDDGCSGGGGRGGGGSESVGRRGEGEGDTTTARPRRQRRPPAAAAAAAAASVEMPATEDGGGGDAGDGDDDDDDDGGGSNESCCFGLSGGHGVGVGMEEGETDDDERVAGGGARCASQPQSARKESVIGPDGGPGGTDGGSRGATTPAVEANRGTTTTGVVPDDAAVEAAAAILRDHGDDDDDDRPAAAQSSSSSSIPTSTSTDEGDTVATVTVTALTRLEQLDVVGATRSSEEEDEEVVGGDDVVRSSPHFSFSSIVRTLLFLRSGTWMKFGRPLMPPPPSWWRRAAPIPTTFPIPRRALVPRPASGTGPSTQPPPPGPGMGAGIRRRPPAAVIIRAVAVPCCAASSIILLLLLRAALPPTRAAFSRAVLSSFLMDFPQLLLPIPVHWMEDADVDVDLDVDTTAPAPAGGGGGGGGRADYSPPWGPYSHSHSHPGDRFFGDAPTACTTTMTIIIMLMMVAMVTTRAPASSARERCDDEDLHPHPHPPAPDDDEEIVVPTVVRKNRRAEGGAANGGDDSSFPFQPWDVRNGPSVDENSDLRGNDAGGGGGGIRRDDSLVRIRRDDSSVRFKNVPLTDADDDVAGKGQWETTAAGPTKKPTGPRPTLYRANLDDVGGGRGGIRRDDSSVRFKIVPPNDANDAEGGQRETDAASSNPATTAAAAPTRPRPTLYRANVDDVDGGRTSSRSGVGMSVSFSELSFKRVYDSDCPPSALGGSMDSEDDGDGDGDEDGDEDVEKGDDDGDGAVMRGWRRRRRDHHGEDHDEEESRPHPPRRPGDEEKEDDANATEAPGRCLGQQRQRQQQQQLDVFRLPPPPPIAGGDRDNSGGTANSDSTPLTTNQGRHVRGATVDLGYLRSTENGRGDGGGGVGIDKSWSWWSASSASLSSEVSPADVICNLRDLDVAETPRGDGGGGASSSPSSSPTTTLHVRTHTAPVDLLSSNTQTRGHGLLMTTTDEHGRSDAAGVQGGSRGRGGRAPDRHRRTTKPTVAAAAPPRGKPTIRPELLLPPSASADSSDEDPTTSPDSFTTHAADALTATRSFATLMDCEQLERAIGAASDSPERAACLRRQQHHRKRSELADPPSGDPTWRGAETWDQYYHGQFSRLARTNPSLLRSREEMAGAAAAAQQRSALLSRKNLTHFLLKSLHGFPTGIADRCQRLLEKDYPLRIWVVDNSGSMQTGDGKRFLHGKGRVKQMIPCRRWDELRDAVLDQAKLGKDLGAPVIFRLLNDPNLCRYENKNTAEHGRKGGASPSSSAAGDGSPLPQVVGVCVRKKYDLGQVILQSARKNKDWRDAVCGEGKSRSLKNVAQVVMDDKQRRADDHPAGRTRGDADASRSGASSLAEDGGTGGGGLMTRQWESIRSVFAPSTGTVAGVDGNDSVAGTTSLNSFVTSRSARSSVEKPRGDAKESWEGVWEMDLGVEDVTDVHWMERAQRDLELVELVMKSAEPRYKTPLAGHMLAIYDQVKQMTSYLRQADQKVVVVIASDGVPSDSEDFLAAMHLLQKLPILFIVRLCTDDDHALHFWNTLHLDFHSIQIEVLDDFEAEAEEILSMNPWLNYAMPIQRAREMGFRSRLLTKLKEQLLTHDELRDFCAMLFGVSAERLPHPKEDWETFYTDIEALQGRESRQWNPVLRSTMGWIDIKRMGSIYGGKAERLRQHREEKLKAERVRMLQPDGAADGNANQEETEEYGCVCAIC